MIKYRFGVWYDKMMMKYEEMDCYDYVVNFVEVIYEVAGVEYFIVYARSAVMGGLNFDVN